jgi:hypothetical protein
VASESFNDVFSSTYENYKLVLNGTSSTGTNLSIRFRVGGSDDSTSNSYVEESILANGTSLGSSRATTNLGKLMSIESNLVSTVSTDIYQPFLANPTGWYSNNMRPQSDAAIRIFAGTHNQSTSYDGLSLIMPSGNFTATISIYGYAKA